MSWQFGDYHLDPARFELVCRGVPVHTEPQVLAVIIYLLRHRSRMVSKEELAEAIWLTAWSPTRAFPAGSDRRDRHSGTMGRRSP